jgi:hypothetical protein
VGGGPGAGLGPAEVAAGQPAGPGGQLQGDAALEQARIAGFLALAQSVRGNTMDNEVAYLDPSQAPPLPGSGAHALQLFEAGLY